MGATTIWERWNSILPDGSISDTGMNSLNHYAYGSIVEWLYRNVCGINPAEDCPGFRKILLAPKPDRLLGFARAHYDSPVGLIESGWAIEGDQVSYEFQVPFGATAALLLPGEEAATLKPGAHRFVRALPRRALNLDSPISEICSSPEALAALTAALPDQFPMMTGELSINDFVAEGFIPPDDPRLSALEHRLAAL